MLPIYCLPLWVKTETGTSCIVDGHDALGGGKDELGDGPDDSVKV